MSKRLLEEPRRVGHDESGGITAREVAYRKRTAQALAEAKTIRVTYEETETRGSAMGSRTLIQVWHSNKIEFLPRNVLPVYGVKPRGADRAPVIFHQRMLCQHPGPMSDCIEAAERSRHHWLKHGDPDMPVGDLFAGFGGERHFLTGGGIGDDNSGPRDTLNDD